MKHFKVSSKSIATVTSPTLSGSGALSSAKAIHMKRRWLT